MALRGGAVLLLCTLVPLQYVLTARDLTVFGIQQGEHRYVAVGNEVGRRLEPNALILTVIQSGSVRLYGNRLTARWDYLDPHAKAAWRLQDEPSAELIVKEINGYQWTPGRPGEGDNPLRRAQPVRSFADRRASISPTASFRNISLEFVPWSRSLLSEVSHCDL